jgi:hypothetical protein
MKTSLIPRSLLLVLVALFAHRLGSASTVVVPSDEEMIIGARAIVRGVVLSSVSGYDEQHQAIFTYTTLQVHQVLKGTITTREIVLKEPGGVAGTRGSILYGIPQFSPQEEVLLYLDTWPDGSLRVYHWFLGKFRIKRNGLTGEATVEREPVQDRVTVLGQSQRGLVTDQSDLASYLERIAVRVIELTVPSLHHEAQFFGSIPLLALPTEIASVDHLRLSPQFTLLNPIQPQRWFEPDEGRVIDFRINPIGIPNPRIVEDILASMAIWSTVPGAAIRLLLGGFTSTCGLTTIDGENTISFNNCDRYSAFSPPTGGGCAGVLAAAGITHFDTSQRREVNGIVFSRALEGNVSFNPHASCFFADPCNVREIATHEFGHALGFGHSKDSKASLYAFAHFDGRCGSLRSDDEAGARFLYPQAGLESPPAISTTTLPGAQAGVYYDHILTASGGKPPYRWRISSGEVPAGMALTNEGSLRGQPVEPGRYGFSVDLTDAAGLRVTKDLQLNVVPRPVGPTPTPVVGNNGLQFYPLSSPVRWLDTRFRDSACHSPRSAVGSGQSLRVSGVGPCFNARIPDTAQVLVGHATVINPGRGAGEYQILPAGMARGETGKVAFQPYQVKTTSFMVPLNVEGAIEIHTTSQLHVVLEVVGYFAPPGPGGLYFHPLPSPLRFLDTQAGGPSCLSHSFPLGTGGTHVERVALNCFGTTIPSAARGFVGNLTVTNLSTTLGTITLYPALVSRPQTVNLQLTGGETVSSQVVVGLSPGGLFSTYTSTRMHVALDLSGYFSPDAVDNNGPGTLYYPLAQGVRLFQTQASGQRLGGSAGSCQEQAQPLSAHQEVTIQARGACGGGSIPNEAVVVSGMVGTPLFSSAGQGMVTFFPADRNRPRSINLLVTPTPSSNNGFIVRLSRSGEFRAVTDRPLDLWIDAGGYFAP